MQNPFKDATSRGKAPPTAGGMLSPHEMEGPGKMFLKAGKEFLDRLVMSKIPNREIVSAIAEYKAQCQEFQMDDPAHDSMQWLDIHLVGWRAHLGAALTLALQGSTSIVSETVTAGVMELPLARDLAKKPEDKKKQEEQQGGK